MDTSGLGLGEKIAAGAGLVLLISMFIFGWFSLEGISAENNDVGGGIELNSDDIDALAEESGEDASANAWQSFSAIDILLLLAVLAAVGAVGMRMSGNQVPTEAASVITGLGALALLLLLFRLISPPDLVPGGAPDSIDLKVDVGRDIGIFIGIIASAAIAYGGYLMMGARDAGSRSGSDRPSPPGA